MSVGKYVRRPGVQHAMVLAILVGAAAPGHAGPVHGLPGASIQLPALHLDGGGQVRLQALEGHQALINFWASWCVPCRAELASLERLAKSRSGRLAVIAASVDDDPTVARAAFGTAYPHLRLAFASPEAVGRYGALGMPYSVVFDARGREVKRVTRAIDWSGSEGAAILALKARTGQ